MALDENLKNVPLTGNFATRSDGSIYIANLVANPNLALSSNNDVKNVTPESGDDAGVSEGANVYSIALFDASGALVKSTKVLYDNVAETLHAPSITSYAPDSLHVSGDLTVLGDADLSGTFTARDTMVVSGNTTILGNLTVSGDSTLSSIIVNVSALSSLWVSGDNHIKGALNVTGTTKVLGDINVSGDVYVRDDMSVSGDLVVDETLTVSNAVSALSGLGVSGVFRASGEAIVDKVLTVSNVVSALSGLGVSATAAVGHDGTDTVAAHFISDMLQTKIVVEGTATSAILSASSTQTLLENTANGNIVFRTNGDRIMTMETGGKVGVGTLDPGQKLDVVEDTAGSIAGIRCDNQDNTNTGSDARYIAKVAGSSGGDPYMKFMIQGGEAWCIGLSNANADKFRITDNATLDSNIALEIDTSQNVFIPDLTVSSQLNVSGPSYFSGTSNVSSSQSVVEHGTSASVLSDFRQPHGAGAFFWGCMVGNGTVTGDEVNFGAGTSVSGVSSVGRTGEANSDDYFLWNDTTDKLDVSATGIYKIEYNGVVATADGAPVFELKLYINGRMVHGNNITVHAVTDPLALTFAWVGQINAAADAVYVTTRAPVGDGTYYAHLQGINSTLFVQRLA